MFTQKYFPYSSFIFLRYHVHSYMFHEYFPIFRIEIMLVPDLFSRKIQAHQGSPWLTMAHRLASSSSHRALVAQPVIPGIFSPFFDHL